MSEPEKIHHLKSMIETDNTNTTEYSNSLLELFLLGDDEDDNKNETYDIQIINLKLNEINLNEIINKLVKFL